MKNIFYFNYINDIGGVESFFYYLSKKYCKDSDITIYYKSGNFEQIRRLSKYVPVIKYSGGIIECDKAFFNYSIDIIDSVKANEYIQIIHADYKAQGIMPRTHHKFTKYIGVSQLACDSFRELTGLDIELCYNPIKIDKPSKVLNLISATRLTPEKGKERIEKLANILDKNGIKFLWTIFTNDTNAINHPNIAYMKPRLDITDYIANSDYLVQLSNSESYCYSVVESLTLGTPVIVTDCPVFKEIGLNDNNSIILDFDLSNVDCERIVKGIKNFKYTPVKDNWSRYLSSGKSSYNPDDYVFVRATTIYDDSELNKRVYTTDPPFQVTHRRASELIKAGVCEILNIKKV